MTSPPLPPSPQDDRLTAALAHVGVLVPYAGVLIPLLVWLNQRNKNTFVEFQALQALLYRLFIMVMPIAVWPFLMLMVPISVPAMALFDNSLQGGAPTGINYVIMTILFYLPLILAILVILAVVALIIFGLFGAAMVYSGRDFKYPVFARLAQRLLTHR